MNLASTAAILALAIIQVAPAQNVIPAKPKAQATSIAGLPDGEFIGLQKSENISHDEPNSKWFYENIFVVRGTEMTLDMQPVVFHNGKKAYSASDGGFLSYRGKLFNKNGQLFVSLRIFQSDYIAFPEGPRFCEPYSQLFTHPVKQVNGVIEINGLHYKHTSLPAEQLNEFLRWLHDVPAEYDGHPYRRDSHAPPCKPPIP
jgi:hypothetical protein